MHVKAAFLPHGEGLPLPFHQKPGDAGMDLYAAIPEDHVTIILPGRASLIPCGVCIELPEGFEAQVRSRSGLALKNSIAVLNSPGTIDSGYRGEIKVHLINHGQDQFVVERGMRIAQMVIARHETVQLVLGELSTSERGDAGYGSTGVAA